MRHTEGTEGRASMYVIGIPEGGERKLSRSDYIGWELYKANKRQKSQIQEALQTQK